MKIPMYQSLAEELATPIRNGNFKSGEKLPSVRGFAREKGVSVSTAVQAFNMLEDWSLVEVRPKSGYYVKARAKPSIEAPILEQDTSSPEPVEGSKLLMAVLRDAARPDVVSLAAAIPGLDFPILQNLKKSFSTLVRNQRFLGVGYDFGPGELELRRQIAKRANQIGVDVEKDDVIIASGCQGAIGLCLKAVCEPGQIVAVESPCYYGLLQLIESMGMKVVEIPSDPDTGMSLDALALAVEQWDISAILTVPSFSNPLGALIPDANKRKLAQLASKWDIPLIEDDIYGELSYSKQRPKPIKAYDKTGHVLLCSSVSKVLEPQLSVGWCLPGKYREEVEYERFLTSTGQFNLPQMAVAQIFAKSSYDKHLRMARDVYRARRDRLFDMVNAHFPEGTRLSNPQGGFVAWLEFADGSFVDDKDATELYLRAKRQGIIIAPGAMFSSNPNKYRNAIRLSYGHEWTKEREAAVETLGRIAKELSAG